MTNTATPPRVFISYSHDSEPHTARVLGLANRLRSHGIDANLDCYEPCPPQGWPNWMLNEIERADFVLVICTETYHRRFRKKETVGGKGATWEGAIITQELYDAHSKNDRFIPCLVSEDGEPHIPTLLGGAPHFRLDTDAG